MLIATYAYFQMKCKTRTEVIAIASTVRADYTGKASVQRFIVSTQLIFTKIQGKDTPTSQTKEVKQLGWILDHIRGISRALVGQLARFGRDLWISSETCKLSFKETE